MRVAEFMTPHVRTVGPSESAELAWDRMKMHGIHHLVVVRDSKILGMLTDRDLGGAHGRNVRENRFVRDLMTPSVITTSPTSTIRDAANLMRGHRAGSLPVVEKGRLVGIITVWDFFDLIGKGIERPVARTTRRTLTRRQPRPASAAAAR